MKKLDAKGFSHLLLLLVAVVGVAVIGTYYLVKSNAQSKSDHVNQPSRGVFYDGLTEATTGPCSGEFESTVKMSNKPTCIHPDPGPAGVDVRVRSKQVEGQLKAQADFDKAHKPIDPSNDPHPSTPSSTITN